MPRKSILPDEVTEKTKARLILEIGVIHPADERRPSRVAGESTVSEMLGRHN
ncbi:MAG: hypothetical protein QGI86_17425 [Candidatus Poribacteria bacterium]|nr:hypothetical protein [Candidatus Poribacteria bacterium]MDP6961189.1 hypothetical protein [Dehalococcoidia bacterium]